MRVPTLLTGGSVGERNGGGKRYSIALLMPALSKPAEFARLGVGSIQCEFEEISARNTCVAIFRHPVRPRQLWRVGRRKIRSSKRRARHGDHYVLIIDLDRQSNWVGHGTNLPRGIVPRTGRPPKRAPHPDSMRCI